MTGPGVRETLYVTHAKGKVHITACPHLFKHSTLTEATPAQIEANGLCTHCEKEIRGEGRTYYQDFDEALREFGHRSDDAHRLIREAIGGVEYDAIWVPASGSYIALGEDGQGVAWIGQGYVETKGRPVVELPWFQPHGGGGARRDDVRGELCEVHFVEKSLLGGCEMCD